MATETEILLRDGNFIRRQISEVSLGSQESLIQKYAQNTGMLIRNMSKHKDVTMHLWATKTMDVCLFAMPSLPVKYSYAITADGTELTPMFREDGWTDNEPGEIIMDDPRPVSSSGFHVFLAVPIEKNMNPSGVYLFAYDGSELRRLPYPNNFNHGAMCMGRNYDVNKTGGHRDIVSIANYAFDSFHETKMNNHLTTPQTTQLLTKNRDGSWKLPVNEIKSICGILSLSWMAGFKF